MDGPLPFLGALILGWYPALYVHELGHALAAWLVGTRVRAVGVGNGQPFLRFEVRGTVFYAAPGLHGRTHFDLVADRPRKVAVIAGGIAANLALGGALLLAVARWSPPGVGVSDQLAVALGVANVLLALDALLPRETAAGTRTDGRQLLDLVAGGAPARPKIHRSVVALRWQRESARARGDALGCALLAEVLASCWLTLGEPEEARAAAAEGMIACPDADHPRARPGWWVRAENQARLGEPWEDALRAALAGGPLPGARESVELIHAVRAGDVQRAREQANAVLMDRALRRIAPAAREALLRCALADGEPTVLAEAWRAWLDGDPSPNDRFTLGEAVARHHRDRGDDAGAREAAQMAEAAGWTVLDTVPAGAARDRIHDRVRALAELGGRMEQLLG